MSDYEPAPPTTSPIQFFRSELDRSSLLEAALTTDLDSPSMLGPATNSVESQLAQQLRYSEVLLTNSATAALEVLAVTLRQHGFSRVIVPSFAHVSCASAFQLHGYAVEFADIGTDLSVAADQVALLQPDRRTVVLAVSYAGAPCDLDALSNVCQASDSILVEDLAHAYATGIDARRSPAVAAVLSFHLTKELTCGEGGALLLAEPALTPVARRVRDRGTDRADFEAGRVRSYTWVSPGSTYAPSELTAAVLLAQIRRSKPKLGKRRSALLRYVSELGDWANRHGFLLPTREAEAGAANTAYVRVPNESDRDSLQTHLAEREIGSASHFPPLHLSPMGRCLGGRPGQCPGAEEAYGSVLRLPLNSRLTGAELDRILEAVELWRP